MGEKEQINENEYYDSIFDRAEELIDASMDKVCIVHDASYSEHLKQWGDKEPADFSYITLDLELKKYAIDRSDVIAYQDAFKMQRALLHWIEQVISPDMLEMVRKGEIEHLTLRLGPRTLSGFNLSKEL